MTDKLTDQPTVRTVGIGCILHFVQAMRPITTVTIGRILHFVLASWPINSPAWAVGNLENLGTAIEILPILYVLADMWSFPIFFHAWKRLFRTWKCCRLSSCSTGNDSSGQRSFENLQYIQPLWFRPYFVLAEIWSFPIFHMWKMVIP